VLREQGAGTGATPLLTPVPLWRRNLKPSDCHERPAICLGRQGKHSSFWIASLKTCPKLTEDLIPGSISLTVLHKVLQNLLSERVSIRDMRSIIEALAEHAPGQTDPDELTALVRVKLGRAITHQWFPGSGEMQVIGLDVGLERILMQASQSGSGLEPGIAENLMIQTERALQRQEAMGAPPVLLVNHVLRLMLSRFLRRALPQLVVMSNMEIANHRPIRMSAIVGGQQ
jgi:flagellar biosynthesis protein FlhA